MIITITDKAIKSKIHSHFPDAYDFITHIRHDKTIVLFKTVKYYGEFSDNEFNLLIKGVK